MASCASKVLYLETSSYLPFVWRTPYSQLRDIYRYDCAIGSIPPPEMMPVANTGFARNVRASFENLPCPIICAQTGSAAIFG